ncbi:LytTR family DNA-binding domain-containing protein [Fulvivirgaceae bacterium BMA10]|uniref:LytTR family DNA-binding domain-containing protein n=1 Tax=Splendidivirga corallicola TaxID=3051826 RepID=A0ABT8KLR5_9BACT|nr:LytTR family DNA-binding domain-containing protein [Fulvivirgaceae bacterium BMA10]
MKEVLIIEDEAAASRRLEKLILEIAPNFTILGCLDSIQDAISWLRSNPSPDLLFMDIHLADGSSFDIFNATKITCPVIFTTAYDQYAIQAFKVNSIDYLLKPIKKSELQQSIQKFEMINHQKLIVNIDYEKLASSIQEHQSNYQERLVVRYGQNIKVIQVDQIAYFYTLEKVVFLITYENQKFALDHNLDQLESMLDPNVFFRINRQFIVCIHAIDKMYTYSKSRVKLTLNPSCQLETIVSTERSPGFKGWLAGHQK